MNWVHLHPPVHGESPGEGRSNRMSRVRLFDIPVCYPVTVEDISLCSLGRTKEKDRKRRQAAATCQQLDGFLFPNFSAVQ